MKLDSAVDATGSIWVASYGNSGGGRVAQIIGLAAPTIPLKALGKGGRDAIGNTTAIAQAGQRGA